MKFSALNVDFSSLSSTRPAHTGVKEGYPKSVYFPIFVCLGWKRLQTGIDVLLIITSTGVVHFIDNLEWPWTANRGFLVIFFAIFGCRRVDCDEIDGHRPRQLVNRNCYRLSRVSWALAQIFCSLTPLARRFWHQYNEYFWGLTDWPCALEHFKWPHFSNGSSNPF